MFLQFHLHLSPITVFFSVSYDILIPFSFAWHVQLVFWKYVHLAVVAESVRTRLERRPRLDVAAAAGIVCPSEAGV
jgi:hypothetical protein